MPVKWTPETDQIVSPLSLPLISLPLHPPLDSDFQRESTTKSNQLISFQLLLKILETSEVSPKPTEISEKWRKSPVFLHNYSKTPYQD